MNKVLVDSKNICYDIKDKNLDKSKRERLIKNEDLIDLKICLETMSVEDFIKNM